jgi:hypothetical protein
LQNAFNRLLMLVLITVGCLAALAAPKAVAFEPLDIDANTRHLR